MKIISIVGARPNFMKIAPLLRAIAKHNARIETKTHRQTKGPNNPNLNLNLNPPLTSLLVHTGQHYDYEMSQIFFKDLELPQPDIYLGVGSGTHAEQTGKVMIELEKVLLEQKPDLVTVVGDVNSTLAGALAAVKLHVPVAHVEAGLRSFDRTMPEEINRLLTDAVSDYLFTPSPDADDNLRKEGIPEDKIFLVGDVMVDSLLYNKPQAEKSDILQRLGLLAPGPDELGEPGQLNELNEPNKLKERRDQSPITNHQSLVTDYALLTLHRPSNVDDKESLLKIIKALNEISQRIPIVFPAHPRTRKKLQEFGLNLNLHLTSQSKSEPKSEPESESKSQSQSESKSKSNSQSESESESQSQSNVLIIPPLGYLDFLNLEMNAKFVMTDSGGIQEETTVLGIPCLTLRNTTERPITLTRGTNTLVWNHTEKIVEEAFKILDGNCKKGNIPELWDGKAAERIVDILAQ